MYCVCLLHCNINIGTVFYSLDCFWWLTFYMCSLFNIKYWLMIAVNYFFHMGDFFIIVKCIKPNILHYVIVFLLFCGHITSHTLQSVHLFYLLIAWPESCVLAFCHHRAAVQTLAVRNPTVPDTPLTNRWKSFLATLFVSTASSAPVCQFI